MEMKKRENTKRLFIRELIESDIQLKLEEREHAPKYLLTPLGAMVNRCIICGTILDIDEREGESSFVMAHLNDPTGTIQIIAGQYATEAMQSLKKLDTPVRVAVIGKPKIREFNDEKIVYIAAESVRQIEEKDIRNWIADTALATMDRMTIYDLGVDEDVKRAKDNYEFGIEVYKDMVIEAIGAYMPDQEAKTQKPVAIPKKSEIEVVDLRDTRKKAKA